MPHRLLCCDSPAKRQSWLDWRRWACRGKDRTPDGTVWWYIPCRKAPLWHVCGSWNYAHLGSVHRWHIKLSTVLQQAVFIWTASALGCDSHPPSGSSFSLCSHLDETLQRPNRATKRYVGFCCLAALIGFRRDQLRTVAPRRGGVRNLWIKVRDQSIWQTDFLGLSENPDLHIAKWPLLLSFFKLLHTFVCALLPEGRGEDRGGAAESCGDEPWVRDWWGGAEGTQITYSGKKGDRGIDDRQKDGI